VKEGYQNKNNLYFRPKKVLKNKHKLV